MRAAKGTPVGSYERLLEKEEEERRRGGGLLPSRRGSGSGVLNRRLGAAPKDCPPGYAADLAMVHRLVTRGSGARAVPTAFTA
jgi:hypothetical protein